MTDSSPVTQNTAVAVIDPKLAYIISQVESSGFSGALRFEPAVYDSVKKLDEGPEADIVKKIVQRNMCTIETAQVIYATSFGLYQIMGHNLYRLGLHTSLQEFLSGNYGRILQDAFFAKFLAGHGINFTWTEMARDQDKLNLFAQHYNGSLAYGNRMKAIAREHYGESLS